MQSIEPDIVLKVVQVVAGVILNKSGQILIALRPSKKHQGNLWEFPGGKLNEGEALEMALSRELQEELGIAPTHIKPFKTVQHIYPDLEVVLNFFWVMDFIGEPHGKEGQPIKWVNRNELIEYKFPEANEPIVRALALPPKIVISGGFTSLDGWQKSIQAIRAQSMMLVLRESNLERALQLKLMEVALEQRTSPVLVSSKMHKDLWGLADGVHLTSHDLNLYKRRPVEDDQRLGASCHNEEEIALANKFNVDYLFISPVAPTTSHPESQALGWRNFKLLAGLAEAPAYALGGLNHDHLGTALSMGAWGVAGINQFWPIE